MSTMLVTRWLLKQLAGRAESGALPAPVRQAESKWNPEICVQKTCRLCARPGHTPILMRLLEFDIVSAIQAVLNITITPDDSYPKYICNDCLANLKLAFNFKRKCQETDMKFRELVQDVPDHILPAEFVQHDFNLLLHQMQEKREALRKLQQEQLIKQFKAKKKLTKKPINQFKCLSCDIPFYDRERLDAHRALRGCIRRPCPVCKKLVLNLPIHTRRQHRRRPFKKCPDCGKLCRTTTLLKTHMHVHSDQYDYSCHLCPYRGKQQAYLTLHMRTHTGERPYLCAHCPATFVNASNFKKHRLTHESKQYECRICQKSFRTRTSLREHDDATHQNVRYPCGVCGKKFAYRAKLLKHELKAHNREKHKVTVPKHTNTDVVATDMHVDSEIDESVYEQMDDRLDEIDEQIVEEIDEQINKSVYVNLNHTFHGMDNKIEIVENMPIDNYLIYDTDDAEDTLVSEGLLDVVDPEIVVYEQLNND